VRRKFTQLLFEVLMGLIKNQRIVGLIFGLLFFPGVVIHEGSHWITAKLLGVQTHRFSLMPTWTDEGTLRFGYVEMTKPDHLRAALVGLAPLVLGTVVVLWIALDVMMLDLIFGTLSKADFGLTLDQLQELLRLPDIWLWMYLLITVSNMMLPSASDRASWVPVGVFLALLLIPLILLRPDVVQTEWVNGLVDGALKSLASAFGLTAILDLLLLIPIWGTKKLMGYPRA
jgi:hypothetical protein